MKSAILITIALFLGFGIGWLANNGVKNQLKESNEFKKELIFTQDAALQKAHILIDRHNLLDKDGSDDMADYLEFSCRVDSLWETQY